MTFKPLLILGLILSGAAIPAHAGCLLTKAGVLPMTISGTRLYVPVTMNDTPGSFVVDTGSERSIVDGTYAARAGIGIDRHAGEGVMSGVGGRETSLVFQGHVRHANIGGLPFDDWEFPVIPATAGGIGKSEHDGLLGMDFLHYFDLDFDMEAGTLTLWRVTGCKDINPVWKGPSDAIPLTHTAHQKVTLPVMIDNAFLDVELDTGSPGMVLSRAAADKAGVTDAALTGKDPGGIGIGGHFPSVLHKFNLLMVGNGEFHDPVLEVETERHRTGYGDGLMGWRYLKPRKMWLSYATNTLFVQPQP